ncbi:MAG: hypothetical protein PVF70_10165 [Anaerolineales bacterium]|jgi:hypothetical protein
MKKNRTLLIVIVTIVAVALLAAGGYALFRLGYARGLATSVGELSEGWRHHEWGNRTSSWMEHGRHPRIGVGFEHSYWGFPLVRGLLGFLLGGGVLALAVYGFVSLVRRNPSDK